MAAAAVVVALLGWAIYQSGNEPEPARSVPTIAPSVSGKIAEAPPAGQTPATTAEPEPAPSPAATTEPASRLPHGPAPAPKPAAAPRAGQDRQRTGGKSGSGDQGNSLHGLSPLRPATPSLPLRLPRHARWS